MAGSQKNRPVDPDIEDSTTFEDKSLLKAARLSGPASGGIESPRDPWYAPDEKKEPTSGERA